MAAALDLVAWATESHKLALGNAYAVPKDGRLGQEYFDKNIPVIELEIHSCVPVQRDQDLSSW